MKLLQGVRIFIELIRALQRRISRFCQGSRNSRKKLTSNDSFDTIRLLRRLLKLHYKAPSWIAKRRRRAAMIPWDDFHCIVKSWYFHIFSNKLIIVPIGQWRDDFCGAQVVIELAFYHLCLHVNSELMCLELPGSFATGDGEIHTCSMASTFYCHASTNSNLLFCKWCKV